jgi:tetratricopeptide (TPR) repeat protein
MTQFRIIPCFIIIFLSLTASGKTDPVYLNNLGLEELKKNRPAEAVEFFLQALEIDNTQKHYYNNLATAYIRMGKYEKAEKYLKQSLKIDSAYARALSNMSVTLFHLGRYRESYKYYLLSMKADPEYTEQRFEKNRVLQIIRKLSGTKPEDTDLKKINDYLESEKVKEKK